MTKRLGFSGVGISSLMAIGAVLCLVVFTMLCISDARSDRALSDRYTKSIQDYYNAQCDAQEVLARLRRGELPEGVTKQGDEYSYGCNISDSLTLVMRVRVNGEEYTVIEEKTVTTGSWQQDEELELWDGNFEQGDN